MSIVPIPTVFDEIRRRNPRNIALVVHKLIEWKKSEDGKDEVLRKHRDEELRFMNQLEKAGTRYRMFLATDLASEIAAIRKKGVHDLVIVMGDPFYQLLSVAAKLQEGRYRGPILLEITEEEAIKRRSREIAEGNATRLEVTPLLRSFVYLKKTRCEPKQIDFGVDIPQPIAPPKRALHAKAKTPPEIFLAPANDAIEPPKRLKAVTTRVVRDTRVSRSLKHLYDFKCQICGLRIESLPGEYYAEAHHLKPLGGEHRGFDVTKNVLVLCPNHHAMFDFGIPIFETPTQVRIGSHVHALTIKHEIDADAITYYNNELCRSTPRV